VEKLKTMVSALAAVNIYRLGYLLIFLGRITTPTGFGLSISFVGDNLGKPFGPPSLLAWCEVR
jgi:hypothetical protein